MSAPESGAMQQCSAVTRLMGPLRVGSGAPSSIMCGLACAGHNEATIPVCMSFFVVASDLCTKS